MERSQFTRTTAAALIIARGSGWELSWHGMIELDGCHSGLRRARECCRRYVAISEFRSLRKGLRDGLSSLASRSQCSCDAWMDTVRKLKRLWQESNSLSWF